MDENITADKMNVLALAKEHKKNCKDSECNVSLILLRIMAEKTGIVFTKEETEVFI